LNQGTWGGRILTLHINHVAGYTSPLLFVVFLTDNFKVTVVARRFFLEATARSVEDETGMVVEMQIKILNGGEISVNYKTKTTI